MLSIRDVPDNVEAIYQRYKELSRDMYARIFKKMSAKRLPVNVDLFEFIAQGQIVYVIEGYFKLGHERKVVRLFSEGDFVIFDGARDGFELRSEFASEVAYLPRKTLIGMLSDKKVAEAWLSLQQCSTALSLALASSYMEDDVQAEFQFKNYAVGEEITREGEAPDAIYELISGEAVVLADGVEVGRIHSGEIFGEIGFLTDSARSATVQAAGNCFVRVVNKDDFFKLIESNPNLIISIAKTLARRVVELNGRLVLSMAPPDPISGQ